MGLLSKVKESISNGENIETIFIGGSTALMASSENGEIDVVKYLIEQGADINATDDWDSSVLMWAVNGGDLETVEYLISKGANIDTETFDGALVGTPLDIAKEEGYTDIVNLLIKYGATE